MNMLETAVSDFGQSLGLPALGLDQQGSATLQVGEAQWSLQAVDDGQALLLVNTLAAPFTTAAQLESALQFCHAHIQRGLAPATLRMGLLGHAANAQWVGCMRLNAPLDARTIERGMDALAQWLRRCAQEAGVAGSH